MSDNTQLAYRQAAVRNASPVELVIILYDILSSDLQSAIQALSSGDVETRIAKLKHGLLALQQLEGSLDLEKGGQAATTLSRFYTMMRGRIMECQFKQDAGILRELVTLLNEVRDAWVQVSSRPMASEPVRSAAPSRIGNSFVEDEVEHLSFRV